jgi:hypothetical protein
MANDNDETAMKHSSRVIFYFVFIAVVAVLFGVMSFHFLDHGDFGDHMEWVRQLAQDGYMHKIPHSLYHKLVVVVRALLPANVLVWVSPWFKQVYDIKSYEIAELILMTLTYLATALILVRQLLRDWKESTSDKLQWWAGLGALVIMLVAPVFIFSLPRMFLGYAAGNRFDSPTYIMAKPFIVLTVFAITNNLFAKWRWTNALWMAGFILCATLAKPNFTISFLPAVTIVLLTFYLRKWKEVNWFYVIFAFGLTALIVIAGQFAINYGDARGDRVVFAPFEAITHLTGNVRNLILFLFMSLLFPLALLILYWKPAKKDLAMQLGGINFLVALAYGLLLGEEINMGVANFWNSVQFATFVFFMTSVVFFGKKVIAQRTETKNLTWREWTAGALLAAHFICGLVYYVAALLFTGVVKM